MENKQISQTTIGDILRQQKEKKILKVLTEEQHPTTLKLHYTSDRYMRVQLGGHNLNCVEAVNIETLSDGSHTVQITLNVKNVVFTTDRFGYVAN